MVLDIPIVPRSRRYGYIYWRAKQDDEVRAFFEGRRTIRIHFMNSFVGEKKVDLAYRRISVGAVQMLRLPADATFFQLDINSDDELVVTCL